MKRIVLVLGLVATIAGFAAATATAEFGPTQAVLASRIAVQRQATNQNGQVTSLRGTVAAIPSAVAPPTKIQQLQRYLTAVKPVASKAYIAQFKAWGSVQLNEMSSVLGEAPDFVLFRAQCRQLGVASLAFKKVARPVSLSEPHGALVGAWRGEAIGCAQYAGALERGVNPTDPTIDARFAYDAAAEAARSGERHWRTEVTVGTAKTPFASASRR
jgi:hypothetical protein